MAQETQKSVIYKTVSQKLSGAFDLPTNQNHMFPLRNTF